MTSGVPAVASSFPEEACDSMQMVLVRHSCPPALRPTWMDHWLAAKAVFVAGMCAAVAFSFFAIRQRKITPAVPLAATKIVLPAAVATPAPAPHLVLPERRDRKLTEFVLATSSSYQSLGPVQLRLTSVDSERGSYNLSVHAKGRRFNRTNVKLNEIVILGNRRRNAPEIVVGAIVQNRVWGYLSEPPSKPPAKHKSRRRR